MRPYDFSHFPHQPAHRAAKDWSVLMIMAGLFLFWCAVAGVIVLVHGG